MKDESKILFSVVILLIATCLAGVGWAAPMGTAFTYQGWLMDKNNKQPAKGEHDFRFSLYDANDLGNKIGDTITKGNVDVKDGFFAVSLDFVETEPNAFKGDARWLEIDVRPGDSTDPCDYDTLSPRTELTLSPYAFYSKTAGSDNDWMVSGDDMYSIPSGNVGIGTSIPNAKLTVNGAILRDGSTMYGTNADTHINLGVSSTTGESGQNYSYATVGGGYLNKSSNESATVGGGYDNDASGLNATVAGGTSNTASGSRATVVGGHGNTASGDVATIGGGYLNNVRNESATVGGGYDNDASGFRSTVGGGTSNTASGWLATVGGGQENTASGNYTTVPGGRANEAKGAYSFAAGRKAKANHQGTFVWADSIEADFVSTGNDQFLIRASGGVGIGTNNPSAKLKVENDGTVSGNAIVIDNDGTGSALKINQDGILSSGGYALYVYSNSEQTTNPLIQVTMDSASSTKNVLQIENDGSGHDIHDMEHGAYLHDGSWMDGCSIANKENLEDVDAGKMLEKASAINIMKYDAKGASDEKHISATAEDFYEVFGLGNDKGIAAKDVASIALVCVKALKAENELLKERIEDLEKAVSVNQANLVKEVQ